MKLRLRMGLAVAALLGCQHPFLSGPQLAACPGPLVPTQEIPGDFALRESARFVGAGVDQRFQLALEKRGESLVLVGLDPLGARLFSVRQRGQATEVDELPAPVLRVPALQVLRDLHRAHFLTARPPPGGAGQATARRQGLRITETWEDGGLLRRRLEPEDAPPGTAAVELRVTPDGEFQIDNPGCGVRSTLRVLSRKELR